ncbi:hypothetical protein ACFV2X_22310 [Streptomyces sp. NPDC059679]
MGPGGPAPYGTYVWGGAADVAARACAGGRAGALYRSDSDAK